jgi:hypothetical protein
MSSLPSYLIGLLFFNTGFNAYRADVNSKEAFSDLGWYMGAEYQFYTPDKFSISGLFDYSDLSPNAYGEVQNEVFHVGMAVDFSPVKNPNNQLYIGGMLQSTFEGNIVTGLRTGYIRNLDFKGNKSAWVGIEFRLKYYTQDDFLDEINSNVGQESMPGDVLGTAAIKFGLPFERKR